MKAKPILRIDLILYLFGVIFFAVSMFTRLPTVDFKLSDIYYVLGLNSIFFVFALILLTMGLIYTYLLSKSKRPHRVFLIFFVIMMAYPLWRLMEMASTYFAIGGFSNRYFTITAAPELKVLPVLLSFLLAMVSFVLSVVWSER